MLHPPNLYLHQVIFVPSVSNILVDINYLLHVAGSKGALIIQNTNDALLKVKLGLRSTEVINHFAADVTIEGTKIYPRSQGMDTMEHVCLVPGWQGGRKGAYSELHSFTNDALSQKTSTWRYMKRPSVFSTWMALTKGHNVSEWKEWLLNPNIKFVKEETLLVLDMWENPGHCLTDVAFSIFLDAYTNDNDACAASINRSSVDYPHFQPAFFTGLGPDKLQKSHWCWHLMHQARLIDIDSFNEYMLNASNVPTQTVCYRRLLIPLPQVHRFPIDWTDPRAISDLLASQGVRPHLTMVKKHIPDSNTVTHPCITEALYPANALHRARQRIFRLFGDNITIASWMNKHTGNDTANKKDMPVLFYGRHKTGKRVWMNQATVQQVLERDYRVRVDIADSTWNSLTPAEQAQLYHNYARIVAPHGAHFANMIYCRNNTRVVEIVLAKVHPAANLTMMHGDDPSKPLSDWYGPHTWYSFARRIGVHHFAFGEPNVPGGFHAKAFNISSIDNFVAFLASRLQLIRREKSTAQ